MATEKTLLTVPLSRKYGSMPTLAHKSVRISLEYRDREFTSRRISSGSDRPKTGNKQNRSQDARGFPLARKSSESPIKSYSGSGFRRESGIQSPLFERQEAARRRQKRAGAAKTSYLENVVARSSGKRRLDEGVIGVESRHSEVFKRLSAFNNKSNGNVKVQGYNVNIEQNITSAKPRLTSTQTMNGIQKKTVSQLVPLEREFQFQDYRQKCIQWLKSLPDIGMKPVSLR